MNSVLSVLVFNVVLFLPFFCMGNSVDKIPGFISESSYEHEFLDLELQGAILSNEGQKNTVMVAARQRRISQEPTELLLLEFDLKGGVSEYNNLFESITNNNNRINYSYPNLGNNQVLLDGKHLVLIPFVEKGWKLVEVQKTRHTKIIELDLRVNGTSPNINKIIERGSNQLTLLGAIGDRALAINVDLDKEKKWNVTSSVIDSEILLYGGAFDVNQDLVVIGEKGKYPETEVWVGNLTNEGELLEIVNFPGRPVDISRNVDGGVGVISQKLNGDITDYFLSYILPGGTIKWSTKLLTSTNNFSKLQVESVDSGGFVVAGIKERGIWLAQLDSNGKYIWDYSKIPIINEDTNIEDLEFVSNLTLNSYNSVYSLSYSAFLIRDRKQKEGIKTINFNLP